MRALLVTLAVLVVTLGCGATTRLPDAADDPTSTDGPARPPASERNDFRSAPPPIVLVVAGAEVAAGPVSYCWSGGNGSSVCVDLVGSDLGDLPEIDGETVEFRVDLPGARFTATLTPLGGAGSAGTLDAVELASSSYRLDAGHLAPGRYRVSLVARVAQGEVPGEFVWTVPG